MNHPHDLLADLVDGTLDAERRAGIQAHLRTCADCRADLEAATAGRDAARSLGVVPAPVDLHERVVATGAGGGRRPGWYRWAAAAAAAAVVAAIALALPNVGSESGGASGGNERAASAEGASQVARSDAAGGAAAVPVEILDRNYDEGDLRNLAKDAASGPSQPVAFSGVAKDRPDAIRCIEQSVGTGLKGRLVRLIQARFDGTPAYIAVYLEGPGAQQPPDTSAVYVASTAGCRFLSTAAAKL